MKRGTLYVSDAFKSPGTQLKLFDVVTLDSAPNGYWWYVLFPNEVRRLRKQRRYSRMMARQLRKPFPEWIKLDMSDAPNRFCR